MALALALILLAPFLWARLALTHVITSPASLNTLSASRPLAGIHNGELFGKGSEQQLWKRGWSNCDGRGVMTCAPGDGTCYTGGDGLIGCCTVSSCVPRTKCIEYDEDSQSSCDMDTGGCLTCSDSESPYCATITNPHEGQYVHWCNAVPIIQTTGYINAVTTSPPKTSTTGSKSTTTTATSTSSTASSTTLASEATQTPEEKTSNSGSSTGTIAGAVCGAAAVGAILVGLLWWFKSRRRRTSSLADYNEKTSGQDIMASKGTDHSSSDDSHPSEPETPYAELAGEAVDDGPYSPATSNSMSELGLGIDGSTGNNRQSCYKVTNPDKLTPINESSESRSGSIAEASGKSSTLPPYPADSRDSTIVSPLASNRDTVASSIGFPSPMTPQQTYIPYRKSYTPSAYNQDPPDSLARNTVVRPPSMPQQYSTASLGSEADLYRGLSKGNGDRPPWVYMSPEDAVSGGWRNSGGTQDEHERF